MTKLTQIYIAEQKTKILNLGKIMFNHRKPKLRIWPLALLSNIQNTRNCMGEKAIVSVAYECETI